jgi:BolA protein
MTDITTAPISDQITARLTDALAPTHLEVINESAMHRGHLGDEGTGESHFRVIVESPLIAGE